jgi:hypothetical protein
MIFIDKISISEKIYDISHYKISCSKSFNLGVLFNFPSSVPGKELAGFGGV